jgi:hypothetical protein
MGELTVVFLQLSLAYAPIKEDCDTTHLFTYLQTPSDGPCICNISVCALKHIYLPSNATLLVVYWFIHLYTLYSLLAIGPEQRKLQIDKKKNWEAKRFHINLHTIMTAVLKPSLIPGNLYYLSNSAKCHFMKHLFRLSKTTSQKCLKMEGHRRQQCS